MGQPSHGRGGELERQNDEPKRKGREAFRKGRGEFSFACLLRIPLRLVENKTIRRDNLQLTATLNRARLSSAFIRFLVGSFCFSLTCDLR